MENHREHREHSGTQRWQKRKITTLCDPLCPLWFNLPYHDQILWKGEKVCALANYRESQNLLVLTFSVVGSSNPPSRCSNHGRHSFVFLVSLDFLVKSEERERREGAMAQRLETTESIRIRKSQTYIRSNRARAPQGHPICMSIFGASLIVLSCLCIRGL